MISDIHSCCRDCIHAVIENKEQTGCKVKMLEHWRKSGVELLECDDDEQNKFYVVNNRFCPWFRNAAWLQKNNIIDQTSVELAIRQENKIKYSAIIIINNQIQHKDILHYIMPVIKQTIPPKYLNIILVHSKINQSEIIEYIKLSYSGKWSVHECIHNDITKGVEDVLFKIKSHYVMVIYPSMFDKMRKDYAEQYNKLLNEQYKQIGIMSMEDEMSFIGLTFFCKSAGNLTGDIISTLKPYDNNGTICSINEI